MGENKLALVIGSGAVKCAAALGLWQVLAEAGIEIDFYVGCSGGSIFSAVMALDYSLQESIDRTTFLWNRQLTTRRNWRALLAAIFPGILGFNDEFSMIDDGPIMKSLGEAFGECTFANTTRPLYIVATDLYTGEPVVLHEGRLVDALRASTAIPYIWKAWRTGERLLVDGSLSNPLPIDVAIKEGADIILAMGFESPYPSRIKSISRYAFHMNSLMTNNLFNANFAFHNLAHHAEIITILPDFDRPVRLFDTEQIPYVIEMGRRAAQEQIPYLQRLIQAG
jgi:NTE family protein